ncbi:MAG: tetratricopeptide repeat protein [Planctomycetota bacterium]
MKRLIVLDRLALASLASFVALSSLLIFGGCAEKLDSPEEFVQLAYRHERAGEFPEAVAAYQKSLELDPQQPTTWYDLGVSYAAMDRMPEAIDAYTKSIEIDPSSARPFNNRATAYARLKQYDKAIADCDRAIELDGNDFLAWRNRGLAKHDKGDLASAITDYDESIRINGKVAETYHYRGNVLLDQKNYARALEDFDQAIHQDDRMAAAYLSRAIALARLGREKDAELARSRAQELGGKVDDVVIASLLPSAAIRSDVDHHVAAVAFVRSELSKAGVDIASGAEPFDLQSGNETSQTRYIVRTVLASDKDASVSFTASELNQIGAQGSSTTLMIVQITVPESKEGAAAAPSFAVLNTMEKWTPNLAQMQPVAWALPVSIAANPVASAESAP